MVCLYHSRDLDGYCSGAIVKHRYPNCKLIGFDYGEPIPWGQIGNGEEVIMVDVSVPMQDMLTLSEYTGNQLTWIDHHVSAIKDFTETPLIFRKLKTVLQSGISACELTWIKYFGQINESIAVTLLGAYDTWRNKDMEYWEKYVLPFQFGMRSICNSPETFPVDLFNYTDIDTHSIQDIIAKGKAILSYLYKTSEVLCRRGCFTTQFEGLTALCLNVGGASSDIFRSVYDPKIHDIIMPFFYNGREWVVSLYSTKKDIDCSAIARKYGGGGHFSASGYSTTNFQNIHPKEQLLD